MQNPDPLCRVLTSGSPSSGDRRRRQSAAAGRLAIAERRIVRRRVERRGVVLVFVVVLLTLLGIMGTAYLATSRIDRQSIVTGRGALPNATTPLLRDARRLDTIAASVERAAKGQLVRDLFNIAPQYALDSTEFGNYAFATFRETLPGIDPRSGVSLQTSWYEDYDAPGRADPWLSSLLATRTPGSPDVYQWPWISAPLGTEMATNLEAEPFFSDPRFMSASGITAANRYAWFNKDGLNEPNPPAAPTTPSLRPADPLNAPVTQRHNVQIAYGDPNTTGGPVTLIRPANAEGKPWDATRVYPSFIIGNTSIIAADADGDGIADSGLSPVVLDASPAVENSINRYLDPINNVVYFAAYRIVDNSAKLNLTTALNQRGDLVNLEISGNPGANEADDGAAGPLNASAPSEIREFLTEDPTVNVPPNGTWGPNYGFFRSNVGLTGVIRDLLAPINQATDPNDFNRVPAQQELRRLIDARFPLLKQNPNSEYMDLPGEGASFEKYDIHRVAATFTGPAYAEFRSGTALEPNPGGPDVGTWGEYLFRSFGDLTEQLVARRPGDPGSYLWSNAPRGGTPAIVPSLSPDTFRWFGTGDAASLAVKNGALVNGLLSPGAGENALSFTLRYSAPNVANNGDEPWGFFPPDAVELWHGWTQDFGVDASATPVASASILPIAAIDATAANDRAFTFTAPGGTGLANVRLPRSPRALFTTYSGVTTTVPKRGDGDVFIAAVNEAPTPGLPIGMPAYSAAESRTAPPPNGNGREIASSVQGTDPLIPGVEFVYPAAKVSAATGSKEELWRAFWSVMTQTHPFQYDQGAGLPSRVSYFWDAARPLESKLPSQNISGDAKYATIEWDATYDPSRFYEAFRSSDRHPSDESDAVADAQRPYLPDVTTNPSREYNEQLKPTQVLSTRQMALIRSAVAACNTIDLRDNDDDITAMNVDITDDNTIGRGQAGDPTISAATPRYYARVYGTEKQLVISAVYLSAGYSAVEIYNPSDVPIKLSAYRLALVNRDPGAGPSPKLTGTIAPIAGLPSVRLGDNVSTPDGFVQPGGFVVVSQTPGSGAGVTTFAATAHPPAAGTPDVHIVSTPDAVAMFGDLIAGPRTRELALFRTRRADGAAFTDQTAIDLAPTNAVRAVIENEVANNVAGIADTLVTTDVRTLVPVDAVDCRFVLPGPGFRLAYTRGIPAYQGPGGSAAAPLTGALAQDEAWRCFYAGKFYPLRTAVGASRDPGTDLSVLVAPDNTEYAWRLVTTATLVPIAQPTARIRTGPTAAGDVDAILAPAIPIQNFTPFDPYVNTPSRPLTTGTAAQPLSARYSRYGYDEYVTAANADPTLRGLFHFVNRFPFGTPFAREMDLTSIPFIGSYKIYRQTAAAAVALYEYVPLPMDAWAVASEPAEVVPEPAAPTTPEIKTVGRFVPLIPTIDSATAANPRNTTDIFYPRNLRNEWAASLTTFVTARQSKQKVYLPDIADSGNGPRFHRIPGTGTPAALQYHLQDQRYVQDGPVLSSSQPALPLDNNPFQDVRWVSFTERNTAVTDPQLNTGLGWGEGERQGLPVEDNRVSALTQGVINLNTAPEFVLRQLPWVVNPLTGQVDYAAGSPLDELHRRTTNRLVQQRDLYASEPWAGSPTWTAANVYREQGKTFAFSSLFELNELSPFVKRTAPLPFADSTVVQPPITTAEAASYQPLPDVSADPAAYMRLGMMNPIGRNEQDADYQVEQANINRISNLAGTRSDAYTVYVTVQAWTYAPALGGTQATQTRLVGERRSAFIVDRSRVSQTNFDPSTALISIPVERE